MPNGMLENRRIHLQQGYEIGQGIWRQLMSDILSEILYDEAVMGDKVLDPDLILKINYEISDRCNYYGGALNIEGIDPEADIKRSKLDTNMRGLVDDYNANKPDDQKIPFLPFEERMPVTIITYDKPVRNNDKHPATKKTIRRKRR